MTRHGIYKDGERKISSVLIDMAQPFINLIDESTCEQDVQSAFRIVVAAWNAVALDVAQKATKYTDMLRQQLHGTDMAFLMETLISRKKDLFGNDQRAIGDYSVTYKNGHLNVRAEARLPFIEKV
jgi:hypothetical protein